jgi:membrane fusion protein (multidrug efflux system)
MPVIKHSVLTVVLACVVNIVPAQGQPAGDVFRGIIRPVNEAVMSTDLAFRIEKLPFREGQSFSKGDVLALFDCRDLEAQLQSAQAMQRAEQLTADNNARLAKSKAAGTFEVELSRAKAAQATAEVEAVKVKLSRCTILAPYDGRVAAMRSHEHEIPEPAQPMMHIVGNDALEIEALLPSQWLGWLKPGTPFTMTVDETGTEISAQVSRIAAVVDPISQTVKVFGVFTSNTAGVLPGMSGPTKFSVPGG